MPTMVVAVALVVTGMLVGALAVLLWWRDQIVLGGKALSHDAYTILRWLGRRRAWFLREEVRQGTKLHEADFQWALSQLYSYDLLEGRCDEDGEQKGELKLSLTQRGVTLEEALTQLGDPFRFFHER